MLLPTNTLMPSESSIGGFSPTLVIRDLKDTESALDVCKEFATVSCERNCKAPQEC